MSTIGARNVAAVAAAAAAVVATAPLKPSSCPFVSGASASRPRRDHPIAYLQTPVADRCQPNERGRETDLPPAAR
jgi:hypothetical protein